MKDIRFIVRVKNNILCRLRESIGLKPKEMAEKIGIGYQTYLNYESMRKSPINSRWGGTINKTAQKILDYHGLNFEEVWTWAILAAEKTEAIFEIDSIAYLNSGEYPSLPNPYEAYLENEKEEALLPTSFKSLTKREADVLAKSFGFYGEEMSYREIGREMGVSGSRVQQIKSKAIRKIKHPKESIKIRNYISD